MTIRTLLPLAIAAAVLTLAPCRASRAAEPASEGVEFFEKKVRPLLVNICFECHSREKKRRGGLLLDSRAAMLKGGDTGPAIEPGHPERSLLIQAVGYTETLRMPPRSKLTGEQIADLTAWVKMGAPWPAGDTTTAAGPKAFDLEKRRKHWSFQPVKPLSPPQVKDATWPRNAVDQFVLARLEAAGLEPAQPADKRTLLRRVTYDLAGLPPTAAEIDAFLRDESPRAYETVVDRLLASPAYGERWGRHWLDLVRYAETCGHEFDFDMPEAYEYRDYVIRAFNADVPYDQFVTEHIAGDLLPKPRRHPTEHSNESILGTGFWFLGEAKHSPVDVRADGADRRDNQIDVFAKAFLGLTVACARCHDHKFDAVAQKDYYALAGYLQSSRYQRAFLDDPERVGAPRRQLEALRSEARALAVAQSAKVLTAALRETQAVGKLRGLDGWRVLSDPALAKAAEQFAAKRQELVGGLKAQAARAAEGLKQLVVFEDFKKNGYRDWFVTDDAFGSEPSTAADVVLQPDKVPAVKHLVGAGLAHSGLVSDKLQGALRSRTFTIEKKHIWYRLLGRDVRINLIIDGFQQIREPIYGGLTFVPSGDRFAWHRQDVGMWVGQRAYIEVLDDGPGTEALDQIVFSDGGHPEAVPNALLLRLLDDPGVTSAEVLARKYQELFTDIVAQWRDGKLDALEDRADRIALLNELLASGIATSPEVDKEETARLQELAKQMREAEAGLPLPRRGMALADGTGENERIFIRGNHKNPGEPAPRQLLVAIAGADQPAPGSGSGRLELAQRLVDPSNPFVARVMVNRLWHHHFGKGIVATPDDFGVQGQPPTHPELLDYLAGEFARQGWSIKAMHRLIVLSSTYRMASRSDPKADEADPQNKLLHRMPVRRLEAEAVRDGMLAVSGRLVRKMYGPGPLPYLTPFMVGRGRPTVSGPLDGDGRRSVYLNVRRNFLNPMFLAFDYPIPFTCIGRRGVSNVPAQALTLLNNPFVVQQAQRWAKRVLAEPDRTPKERVTSLYVSAFAREPSEAELNEALAFLAEQGKEYGKPDDPRAWADLCHVLFNVKEFIFVN
jgi:cytochrome c553